MDVKTGLGFNFYPSWCARLLFGTKSASETVVSSHDIAVCGTLIGCSQGSQTQRSLRPPTTPLLCLYEALQFLAFNLRSQRILLLLYKPTWDSWLVHLGWDLAQKGESCAPSQTLSLCSFLREPSPIFSLPSGQFFISFYSLQKYSLIYLRICLFVYGL